MDTPSYGSYSEGSFGWDEMDELWDEIGPGLVDELYDLPENQERFSQLPQTTSGMVLNARKSGGKTELSKQCKKLLMAEVRSSVDQGGWDSSDEVNISQQVEKIFRDNFSTEVIGNMFDSFYEAETGSTPKKSLSPSPPSSPPKDKDEKGEPTHIGKYLPKYGDHISFLVDNPEMIGNPPNALIVYTVTVTTNRKDWSELCFPGKSYSVQKRYNDFEVLWQKIKEYNLAQGKKWDFKFAQKSAFFRFKPLIVQRRLENFNDLLSRVAEQKDLLEQKFIKQWFVKDNFRLTLSNNTAPLSFIAPQ